jgi:hypothetical protein
MGAQALAQASSACAREIVRRARGSMASDVRRSHGPGTAVQGAGGRPGRAGAGHVLKGKAKRTLEHLEPRASSLEPVLMRIRDAVLLSFHLPACYVLMGAGRAAPCASCLVNH